MNTVEITRKATQTRATTMKVGDVAVGTEAPIRGAIILRTFANFVNLSNPEESWVLGDNLFVDIRPAGSVVTLLVGGRGMENEMLESLKVGNLISAIKTYRTYTSKGLQDSKKAVEEFRQKSWDNDTLPKTVLTRYPGAAANYPVRKSTLPHEEDDSFPF